MMASQRVVCISSVNLLICAVPAPPPECLARVIGHMDAINVYCIGLGRLQEVLRKLWEV